MKIQNNSVLITGGGSGIGRLMGRIALEKGARCVIIWDINQAGIDKVLEEHNKIGKAYGFKVDVSNYEAVSEAYKQTVEQCGQVDILINCAGIVTSNKYFDLYSPDEIERTIRINTIAPMYVALPIVKDMVARDNGHVCNITSAAGFLGNPRLSAYAASKWGAMGFSESLRVELHERKSHVRVSTIAPFFINTGMFEGVKSWFFPILDPEKTAKKIIKAIENNKDFKGMPFSFHFSRLSQGLLPAKVFDWAFGELFGIYHAMDNFTGRKPQATEQKQ